MGVGPSQRITNECADDGNWKLIQDRWINPGYEILRSIFE